MGNVWNPRYLLQNEQTKKNFMRFLIKLGNSIGIDVTSTFVNSMLRCLKAVIKARGGENRT